MVHGKSPPRRSDESAALEHSGRVTFKAHNRRLLTKSGCSVSGRPPAGDGPLQTRDRKQVEPGHCGGTLFGRVMRVFQRLHHKQGFQQ